ncbi:MAG: hypothetical protein IJY01_01080 [Clostridia bacterium]|nr:hypothetical protein [Clostridia bacterium]
MKKIISIILTLAALLGCMTALSSCGAPKNAGAEISVYLGEEIYDFDPTDYYVDANQEAVMGLLFEPLFNLSKDGDLEKDAMAKGYRVDKELRQIVIELRESYWSDEKQVAAEDFVYAWRNVLLDPTRANASAALLYDIENAADIKRGEKSVYELGAVASATDEITITYREGADVQRLLKNLASVATSPIRQDIYDTASGYFTKVINYAVTNGPFKIATVDYAQGSFTVARNVGYHQPTTEKNFTKQVKPAELISSFNIAGNTAPVTLKDLEEKVVFYMSDATLADRKENERDAKRADALSTYTYVFNVENPLFAIKEVRAALSMALDREAIVSAITFGKAATGFLTESYKDIRKNNALISTTAKTSEAQELLAGVDFTGIDKSFTLTVNGDEESVAIANLAKSAWGALGFTVTVETVNEVTTNIVDFKNGEKTAIKDSALQLLAKSAASGKRDFDVIGIDWMLYSSDAFVPLTAFSTGFNGNGTKFGPEGLFGSIGGWKSDAYDALIKEAYEATDKSVRNEKLRAAEKLMLDEAAVAPVVFNQSFYFTSRDLSGVEFDGFGNAVFTDVSQKNYEKYLND